MHTYKCPVAHLSFSSLQEYCKDRSAWNRHYIKKIWNDKKPVAMLVGEGAHFIIEQFYKANFGTVQTAFEKFKLIIEDRVRDGTIEWKDPENFQEELEEVYEEIPRIANYAMDYIRDKIVYDMDAVEPTYHCKIEGSEIMYKAKIDLVTKDNVIRDWKFVAGFSSTTKIKPAYILQGIGYALARAKACGALPEKVIFVEIKKSKNYAAKLAEYETKLQKHAELLAAHTGEGKKPRKPTAPKQEEEGEESTQYQEIVIDVTKENVKIFTELYRRVSKELMGDSLITEGLFIPNPFQMFGWEDGWVDFYSEVVGYDPYTGEIRDSQDPLKPETVKTMLNDVLKDKAIMKELGKEFPPEYTPPTPVFSTSSIRNPDGTWTTVSDTRDVVEEENKRRDKEEKEKQEWRQYEQISDANKPLPAQNCAEVVDTIDDEAMLARIFIAKNVEAKKIAKELNEKHVQDVVARETIVEPEEDIDLSVAI